MAYPATLDSVAPNEKRALTESDIKDIAIETLDSLSRLRALTDQESVNLAKLLGITDDDEVYLRPCPPDFDAMYIELGPKHLPAHYGAWNRTTRRWSEERGRDRLRDERARMLAEIAVVRRERKCKSMTQRATIAAAEKRRRVVCAAEPAPDPEVLRAAAHYLRFPENGGHRVSPSGQGDWFIGAVRVTAQDLIRRAVVRGFDPRPLRLAGVALPDDGRSGVEVTA